MLQNLDKWNKVAIVSLSRGILWMHYCKHELDLGLKRLKSSDLEPIIMPNALKEIILKIIQKLELKI